jgi:hypothetical protein
LAGRAVKSFVGLSWQETKQIKAEFEKRLQAQKERYTDTLERY